MTSPDQPGHDTRRPVPVWMALFIACLGGCDPAAAPAGQVLVVAVTSTFTAAAGRLQIEIGTQVRRRYEVQALILGDAPLGLRWPLLEMPALTPPLRVSVAFFDRADCVVATGQGMVTEIAAGETTVAVALSGLNPPLCPGGPDGPTGTGDGGVVEPTADAAAGTGDAPAPTPDVPAPPPDAAQMVTVPALVDLSTEAAYRLLDGLGLKIGTITTEQGYPAPSVSIRSQAPAGGMQVPPGTAVDLGVRIPLDGGRFLQPTVPVDGAQALQAAMDYYAKVDPGGARNTVAGFKAKNGFDQPGDTKIDDLVYVNQTDLGYGRRLFLRRKEAYVAVLVENYLKIEDAIARRDATDYVAMEFSPPDDNPGGLFFTKFFAYGKDNKQILSTDIDGSGRPQFLPSVCLTCHGGTAPGDRAGDLDANFIPYDLDTFAFAPDGTYTRVAQEAQFKQLNATILRTFAPSVAYAGPPIEIPDGTGENVFVDIPVPDLYGQVKSVSVAFESSSGPALEHDSVSDLTVTLLAPNGSSAVLWSDMRPRNPKPDAIMEVPALPGQLLTQIGIDSRGRAVVGRGGSGLKLVALDFDSRQTEALGTWSDLNVWFGDLFVDPRDRIFYAGNSGYRLDRDGTVARIPASNALVVAGEQVYSSDGTGVFIAGLGQDSGRPLPFEASAVSQLAVDDTNLVAFAVKGFKRPVDAVAQPGWKLVFYDRDQFWQSFDLVSNDPAAPYDQNSNISALAVDGRRAVYFAADNRLWRRDRNRYPGLELILDSSRWPEGHSITDLVMGADGTLLVALSTNTPNSPLVIQRFRGLGGRNLDRTIFDDAASIALKDAAAADQPFAGSWRPTEALTTRFQGLPAKGTWKLRIADTVAGVAGRLRGVSLRFPQKPGRAGIHAASLIESWYGGPSLPGAFNNSYTPPGWLPPAAPANAQILYQGVVRSTCRFCHAQLQGLLSFDSYRDFMALAARQKATVFDEGISPFTKKSFQRFWTSYAPSQPALLAQFLPEYFPNAWVGPGRPTARATTTPLTKPAQPVYLDGSRSTFAQSYRWVQRPGGSTVTLNNADKPVASFVAPSVDGNLVFDLTVQDQASPPHSDRISVTVQVAATPKITFRLHVYPEFSREGCKGCHGGSSPSGGLSFSQSEQTLYDHLLNNRNLVMPSNPNGSLLLTYPTSPGSHDSYPRNPWSPSARATVSAWIAGGALF
jgi:hypothetical protein